MQVVKHHFFRLLLDFLLLTQNHVALALNSRGVELRVLQNVGHNVHCLADVLAERLGVEYRLLTRRVSI